MLHFFLTALLMGVFFSFLAIRIILKKEGEFSGTCASQNPFLHKEGVRCSLCKRTVGLDDRCERK